MLIEFLIATTDRKDLRFLDRIFARLNDRDYAVLVINQCINIPLSNIRSDVPNIRCLSFQERGVSKSRNKAVEHAVGDICVFCDDDIILEGNVVKTIREAYASVKSDIITFKIITPEGTPYKSYPHGNKAIKTAFDLMHVSSIEITFKRDRILEKKVSFLESMGLGTDLYGGEEICFLHDCIKKQLSISFCDQYIVEHPKEASGKNYADKRNAKANGAVFKKLFPSGFILWIIYFAVKRWPVYRHKYSLIDYVKFMLEGSRSITNQT